jgi:hypothetical protein
VTVVLSLLGTCRVAGALVTSPELVMEANADRAGPSIAATATRVMATTPTSAAMRLL